MSSISNSSDNSSDDCPWKSDDSEDQCALLGKQSKIFTVNDEEYFDVDDLRKKLLVFTTKVDRVVDTAGWNADAVHNAVDKIYEYIDEKYEKYQGYLLLGLIERDGSMGIEPLLSKEVRDVSFFDIKTFSRR